jgi:NTE family protein
MSTFPSAIRGHLGTRRRRRGRALGDVFVCSGGGNLGAAQVGMLRALVDGGVIPSALVGCSVGALNAAFVAVDPSAERMQTLEEIWRSIGPGDVFAGSRRSMATHLLRRDPHLYEPDGLRGLIERFVPLEDLSDTAVPLHVVTTDLEAGVSTWWTAGTPAEVLAASACLPGVFPPVRLAGRLHVDGGVLNPVPVGRAIDLGARTVWVLDVSADRSGPLPDHPSALDVLLASFAAARRALQADADRLRDPDQRVVSISVPAPRRLDVRDFSKTGELIEAGYAAAAEALGRVARLAG